MRRFGLSLLAAIFILTTASLASAKGAKGAKKAAEKTTRGPAPLAKAKEISEFKGDYKWGMTPQVVMEKLYAAIEAGYKDKVDNARVDPARSDQVRRMIKADKDAVTKSLVKFDSQNAAWGTSIIDEEFIPNNGESMLFVREPTRGGLDGNQGSPSSAGEAPPADRAPRRPDRTHVHPAPRKGPPMTTTPTLPRVERLLARDLLPRHVRQARTAPRTAARRQHPHQGHRAPPEITLFELKRG